MFKIHILLVVFLRYECVRIDEQVIKTISCISKLFISLSLSQGRDTSLCMTPGDLRNHALSGILAIALFIDVYESTLIEMCFFTVAMYIVLCPYTRRTTCCCFVCHTIGEHVTIRTFQVPLIPSLVLLCFCHKVWAAIF